MAAIPPGALIPWIEQRFLTLVDGVLAPNAAGSVQCFASDGTTPKPTFSDPSLDPGLENPVVIMLDDDGRPPTNLYMDRGGYTFVVRDRLGNVLYTVSCEDTAGTFFAAMGALQSQGAKDVPNGYEATNDDHYITTDPNEVTDPSVMILPDRTTWEGGFLIVKNKSNVTWQLTPKGTQTIEGINSAVLLGPASGGVNPTIIFLPVDGGWDIVSGMTNTTAPTLVSVVPDFGYADEDGLTDVTITGTGFVAGATTPWTGSGIAVTNIVVVNSTTLTCTFFIPAGAGLPTGSTVPLIVQTPNGLSNSIPFRIAASI